MSTFPERLRLARRRQALTQQQLQELSGVWFNAISRYEKGHVAPSLESAAKLARALGVSLDWLSGLEEDQP